MDQDAWYALNNPDEVPSPALLIYPQRIRNNIARMIEIAGNVNRLRPHVKTHKMPRLIALQVSFGIKKFKCATIAEAEITALNGGEDILLAYQPVGPNIQRFIHLIEAFPQVTWSTLVDNKQTAREISDLAAESSKDINLFVDIDVGMHRTGIADPDAAVELILELHRLSNLVFAGLHVYDGHIHEPNPKLRARECLQAFEPVNNLLDKLADRAIEVTNIVVGGTPTFGIHARNSNWELSPGTPLLWDIGYSTAFLDLEFEHAAVVLSRVISRPGPGMYCLDLGYKAIAAEMEHPRVHLQGLGAYKIETHSEEHLVISTDDSDKLRIGQVVYGIPMHICPTVALYDNAYIVENHKVIESWNVLGRQRKISI